MSSPVSRTKDLTKSSKNSDLKGIQDPLKNTRAPELFIGLVGPLGSDLSCVYSQLENALLKVGYKTIEIKLSDGLSELPNLGVLLEKEPEDKRIRSYMEAGTRFRESLKRGDALALMSVARIRQERDKHSKEGGARVAYVLRSLKHRKEVEAFRKIYGDLFFLVSTYLPRENRVSYLADKIAKSNHSSDSGIYRSKAEELIQIDQSEEGKSYGQDVGGAFPLADLFIDISSYEKSNRDIDRFVEVLFGYPFHTPTKDEFGMYIARASALRSADLSRQVGAAIMTNECSVISLGCNEVPRFGGGSYWPGDEDDDRDFRRGFDSSAKAKKDIVVEILSKLIEGELLNADAGKEGPEKLAKQFLGKEGILKNTQATNLLEYGRMVHAEMSAITDAARRGVDLQSATLYCTTFPCHMCARHIIASGIERVVYIEPYPKSKAAELYRDSIIVDPPNHIQDRLRFEPFVGIAPVSYIRLFEMTTRKNSGDLDGKIVHWIPQESAARPNYVMPNYTMIETEVIRFIAGQIQKNGLNKN